MYALMEALRPEARSIADTLSRPLASISKVVTSSAWPLGIGGIPVSSNSPSRRLSLHCVRSPSYTGKVTVVWLSSTVVNTRVLFVGIGVLRGTTTPNTGVGQRPIRIKPDGDRVLTVALHGNTEGEGSNIEEKEVSSLVGGLASENGGLDGSTVRNGLIGIDGLVQLAAAAVLGNE